jgi:signal transduction histidine kinase
VRLNLRNASAWLRPTVRLRLTLLYSGLFLATGAALVALTYVLARADRFTTSAGGTSGSSHTAGPTHLPPGVATRIPSGHSKSVIDLHQLLVLSALAFAITAVASIVLGWLVAGRVLRPLRTITNTARRISSTNLHERLALQGPKDELAELGDTFDELLDRLESSFTAQRQFVAQASHELRTPLAVHRTLLELALGDPDATVDSLQANNQRLLAADEQLEQLIEALLNLARSEHARAELETLNLAMITGELLHSRERSITKQGLHLTTWLANATTVGDRRLIEQLIANLIDNAIRHNTPSGYIEIRTMLERHAGPERAVIAVANSGPVIPAADVDRLFEPFQRLDPQRHARNASTGLGLSIVHAIATAHDAAITAQPRAHGGLQIEVSFPRAGLDETEAQAVLRATSETYLERQSGQPSSPPTPSRSPSHR